MWLFAVDVAVCKCVCVQCAGCSVLLLESNSLTFRFLLIWVAAMAMKLQTNKEGEWTVLSCDAHKETTNTQTQPTHQHTQQTTTTTCAHALHSQGQKKKEGLIHRLGFSRVAHVCVARQYLNYGKGACPHLDTWHAGEKKIIGNLVVRSFAINKTFFGAVEKCQNVEI